MIKINFLFLFLFLFLGAEENIPRERYFYRAIILGDLTLVKKYIQEGIDINFKDNTNITPLVLATKYNHTEIIKLLLKNKAQVNVKDEYMSPLVFAIRNNNIEIVKLLISSGADLNIYDGSGKNLLTLAASQKCYAILELLLKTNFFEVDKPDKNGETLGLYATYDDEIKRIMKNLSLNMALKWQDIQNEYDLTISIWGNEIFINFHATNKNELLIELKKIKDKGNSRILILMYASSNMKTLDFVIRELNKNKINDFVIKPLGIEK